MAPEDSLSRSHSLDVTGYRCPVPLLLTGRFIRELEIGERLEVVGDDPDMLDDIREWCHESGNRLLETGQEGGQIRCLVEKTG